MALAAQGLFGVLGTELVGIRALPGGLTASDDPVQGHAVLVT